MAKAPGVRVRVRVRVRVIAATESKALEAKYLASSAW